MIHQELVLLVILAFLLIHTDVATAIPNALPKVIPAKAGIHSLTAKNQCDLSTCCILLFLPGQGCQPALAQRAEPAKVFSWKCH